MLVGEEHLRNAVREYVRHYHRERPPQGPDGEVVEPAPTPGSAGGAVACSERPGGLLRHYYREAA